LGASTGYIRNSCIFKSRAQLKHGSIFLVLLRLKSNMGFNRTGAEIGPCWFIASYNTADLILIAMGNTKMVTLSWDSFLAFMDTTGDMTDIDAVMDTCCNTIWAI
jgi:hypothetical protein